MYKLAKFPFFIFSSKTVSYLYYKCTLNEIVFLWKFKSDFKRTNYIKQFTLNLKDLWYSETAFANKFGKSLFSRKFDYVRLWHINTDVSMHLKLQKSENIKVIYYIGCPQIIGHLYNVTLSWVECYYCSLKEANLKFRDVNRVSFVQQNLYLTPIKD